MKNNINTLYVIYILNMREKSFVYLLKVSNEGIYKIGVSKNVEKRVKQLQTGNPEPIEILKSFLSQYPYKLESVLHRRYNYNHVQGECFYMEQKDIDNFEEDCLILETNFKILDEMNNPYF